MGAPCVRGTLSGWESRLQAARRRTPQPPRRWQARSLVAAIATPVILGATMSWLDKVKETASSASTSAQRQARRARLEIAANRIERRIRGRKTAIGTAVFPKLKSGELSIDIPDVDLAMTAIEALQDELDVNRAALATLKLGGEVDEVDGAADDG